MPDPDETLIRVLAEARSWAKRLHKGISLNDLARELGHSESYLRTRIALAFLSPKIQRAILEGPQPAELTITRLMQLGIPLNWVEQERRFNIN